MDSENFKLKLSLRFKKKISILWFFLKKRGWVGLYMPLVSLIKLWNCLSFLLFMMFDSVLNALKETFKDSDNDIDALSNCLAQR